MASFFVCSRCWFCSRRVLPCLAVMAAASVLFSNPAFAVANEDAKAEAERLIAMAVQAEISGDIGRSFTLLHDAVRVVPDNRVARAQLGDLKVDGKWITAEEAQRRAVADPLQSEYGERRKTAGKSAQGQLAL